MKPTVSCIVPTYNNEDTIEKCISSILKQACPIKEIITVNDGSTDKTLEKLKNFKIKIIDLKENKGPSYARNAGMKYAKGDIIFFVEADAYYEKNYLKRIIKKMLKNKEYAGGIGNRRVLNFNKKSIFHNLISTQVKLASSGREPMGVWIYWRKILKKAGKFNENLRVGEDVDMGNRVKNLGYKLFVDENAIWWHKEPGNLKEFIKHHFKNGKRISRFLIKNPSQILKFKGQCFMLVFFPLLISCFFNFNLIYVAILLLILWMLYYSKISFKIKNKKLAFLYPSIKLIENISFFFGQIYSLIKK